MVKAYSEDLRIKVINYINQGFSQISACEIFQIGRNTIYRWKIQQKTTNSLKPKIIIRNPRKINYQKLKEVITENPDKTLKELGKIFNVTGYGISKALQKLKITFKKKPLHIKKETK